MPERTIPFDPSDEEHLSRIVERLLLSTNKRKRAPSLFRREVAALLQANAREIMYLRAALAEECADGPRDLPQLIAEAMPQIIADAIPAPHRREKVH